MPLGMGFKPGWSELGVSRQGRPVRAYKNFEGSLSNSSWTLFLGGTHGDERATVPFLEKFVQATLENSTGLGPMGVLPALNPDGYADATRYNSAGVDLNRNLPSRWSLQSDEPSGPAPLSEPEARLLHDFLIATRPARIVSLHWALSELDADGKGSELAQGMWESLSDRHRRLFRLNLNAGQTLSGSLGSFCAEVAWETALVTLELPYHPEPDLNPLPENHLQTIHSQWRDEESRYWDAVYPAVETMLRFAAKI